MPIIFFCVCVQNESFYVKNNNTDGTNDLKRRISKEMM